MRICLYLDRARTFRWHEWLTDALIKRGHEVSARYSPLSLPLPKSYATLFAIERWTYGLGNKLTAIDPAVMPMLTLGSEPFDVVIDCVSDGSRLPVGNRILTPYYNGLPTIFGALSMLLGSGPMQIEVRDSAHLMPWLAHPAMADRDILLRELDNVFSCTAGLLLKTLTTKPSETTIAIPYPSSKRSRSAGMAYRYATMSIVYKGRRYLHILAKGHRSWAVAWRYDTASLMERGTAAFRVLPNPEGHFYADPFPFRYGGYDYLFVEDFDLATGIACISVAEVNGARATTPRPVLQTGHHLSYPYIFTVDNNIWMIPESGETSEICLYRAVKFPDKWTCEGVVLSGVNGYDTTLLLPTTPSEPIWLFISERMWNSTGWDSLSIFHSKHLLGPWTPHDLGNPLLIDARLSRPAGSMFRQAGRTIRPVQDCSFMYGGAVNLCRIDRLSSQDFAQTVIGTIECNPRPKRGRQPITLGCHTYNYSHGLEVIDVFGREIGHEVTAFYHPAVPASVIEKPTGILEPLPMTA